MKRFFCFTCLCLLSFFSYGQDDYGDSLRKELANTGNLLDRFTIMNKIIDHNDGTQGVFQDWSSGFDMHKIAQELKNDSLLAISFNVIGNMFRAKADFPTALEYFFKGLPLAQKSKDNRRISSFYFDIAECYYELENLDECLKYNKLGWENLPDKSSSMYDFMAMQFYRTQINYYLKKNMPDSALQSIVNLEEANKQLHKLNYVAYVLVKKGVAHWLKRDTVAAGNFFQLSQKMLDSNNLSSVVWIHNRNYTPFLIMTNQLELALLSAQKLFRFGNHVENNSIKLMAADFLNQIYHKLGKPDSSYYYLTLAYSFKDSVFRQNNFNKIQALSFNEQLRKIDEDAKKAAAGKKRKENILFAGIGLISLLGIFLYINNRQKQKVNKVLQIQKKKVETTLSELKSAQSQLIQSEKMASLGELTAGIAHEIQNPLNFVNNFSDVSNELLDEMKTELEKGNVEEAAAIADDVKQNLEKILHHGKRADGIVKGMLQHSRSSSGQKELTDINALCDEYLRLSYHGLRAKDKSFNAKFDTEFDNSIEKINIIPQDIGRVILNLINNAFYAVSEKKKTADANYEPTVIVSTKKENGKVLISVADNGNGIPLAIKDKIFQPFFTTKPTGQGTGLGLSLSYDIVTKGHGGEMKVETKEGEGTNLIIQLPLV